MSRIRTIKPEFWTSAQVLECSRNARLLFLGLWNFCDDAGRHPASPKQCKAEVFPSDDLSIEEVDGMLHELSANGLIRFYVVDGVRYFVVTGWHHQRIDKPQAPKYPEPVSEDSENVPRVIPPDTIGRDTIGREGMNKERSDEKPSVSESGCRLEFSMTFWPAYPNQVGKRKALFSFIEARKRAPLADIMEGLARYVAGKPPDRQWLNPANFLDEDRWKDRPAPVSNGKATPNEKMLRALNDIIEEGNGHDDQRLIEH